MATSKPVVEKNVNIPVCSICKSDQEASLSLKCLHTFCHPCAKNIIHKTKDKVEKVFCPVCSEFIMEKSTKGKHIIKGLANVYSEIINVDQEEKFKCNLCKEKPRSHFCLNCEKQLCEKCMALHSNIPSCEDHKVISIAEKLQSTTLIPVEKMCPTHPKYPIVVSCKPCKKAICYECKIKDHSDHPDESIESALKTAIPEAKAQIECVKQKYQECLNEQYRLKTNKTNLSAKYDDIIKQAEGDTAEKINKLKQNFDRFKEDILAEKGKTLQVMADLEEKLGTLLSSMESLISQGEAIVDNAEGSSVLYTIQNDLMVKAEDSLTYSLEEGKEFTCDISALPEFTPQALDLEYTVGNVNFPLSSFRSFSTQLSTLAVQGDKHDKKWEPINYFSRLFVLPATPLQKDKELILKHRYYRLCYFDEKLWCPSFYNQCIDIYNACGEYISAIDLRSTSHVYDSCTAAPRALHPLNTGMMLIAADTGLYVMDVKRRCVLTKIMEGNIKDVHVNHFKIAVLQYVANKKSSVHILQASSPYTQLSHWQLDVEKPWRLLLTVKDVYVSVHDPDHQIFKYNLEGEKLTQYGKYGYKQPGEMYDPILCGQDPSGDMLVADWHNHRLQVLSTQGQWTVGPEVPAKDPYDVLCVDDHLYILENSIHTDKSKLIIFMKEQP